MYSATFGRLCKSVAKSNPWTGMQSQNVLLWVGLFEVPSRVGMLRAPSERNAKQPKSRRNAKQPNYGASLVVLRSVASCVVFRSASAAREAIQFAIAAHVHNSCKSKFSFCLQVSYADAYVIETSLYQHASWAVLCSIASCVVWRSMLTERKTTQLTKERETTQLATAVPLMHACMQMCIRRRVQITSPPMATWTEYPPSSALHGYVVSWRNRAGLLGMGSSGVGRLASKKNSP